MRVGRKSTLTRSYGRDRMIFGSAQLSTLSERTRVPVIALLVAGAVPALIAIAGLFLEEMIKTIIVFGSAGIYVAFQMIVLGALVARAKGWKPSGTFRLGVWAWPVNLAALTYGVLAIVNMVWPRTPQDPWYRNYGMIVGTLVVLASGTLYAVLFRPYDRMDAPEGDAHLAHLDAALPSDADVAGQATAAGSPRKRTKGIAAASCACPSPRRSSVIDTFTI